MSCEYILDPKIPTAVGAARKASGVTWVRRLASGTVARHSGSAPFAADFVYDRLCSGVVMLATSILFDVFTDRDAAGGDSLGALRHGE
jgi:hypothetical protein